MTDDYDELLAKYQIIIDENDRLKKENKFLRDEIRRTQLELNEYNYVLGV